jgi:hypothetical protein
MLYVQINSATPAERLGKEVNSLAAQPMNPIRNETKTLSN